MSSDASRRKQRHWGCFVCKNLRNPLRNEKCSVCNSKREVDRFAFRIEDQSFLCRVNTSKSIKTLYIFRVETLECKTVMLKGGSDELRDCVYLTLLGEVTRENCCCSSRSDNIDVLGDGTTLSTLTLTTTDEISTIASTSQRRSSRTLFDQVLQNAGKLAYDASIGQFVHIDTLKLRGDESDNGLIVRDVNYIKFMTREKEEMGKIVAEVRDRRDHPDDSSTASIASAMAKSAAALAEWQGRAPCGLCGVEFPIAQLMGTITNRAVVQWLTSHGVILKPTDSRRLQSKLYDKTKLCLFCTQFFDLNFGDVFDAERAALARATGEPIDVKKGVSKVKRKLQKQISDDTGLQLIEEKLKLEELKHKSKSASVLSQPVVCDGLTRGQREERRKEFIKAKRRFREAALSVSLMAANEMSADENLSFQNPPMSHRSSLSEQPTQCKNGLPRAKSTMLTELLPNDDEQSIKSTIPERGRSKLTLPRKSRSTHSMSRRSVSTCMKNSQSLRRGRSLESSKAKSIDKFSVVLPKRRSVSMNINRPRTDDSRTTDSSAQRSRRKIVQLKSDKFPRAIDERKPSTSKTTNFPADILLQLPKLKPTPLVLVHADGSKSAVASKSLNDTLKRPPPDIVPNARPRAPAIPARRVNKCDKTTSLSKSGARSVSVHEPQARPIKKLARHKNSTHVIAKPDWVMPTALPKSTQRRQSSPQQKQRQEKKQQAPSKRKKLISLVAKAENAYDKRKAKRRSRKKRTIVTAENCIEKESKVAMLKSVVQQPVSEKYSDDFEALEDALPRERIFDDVIYMSEEFESVDDHPATDDFASVSIHTADNDTLYENDEFETDDAPLPRHSTSEPVAAESREQPSEIERALPQHHSLKSESPAFIMTTIDAEGKYHFQMKASSPQQRLRAIASRDGKSIMPIFAMSPPSSAGFSLLYSPPGSSKFRRQADSRETNYLEIIGAETSSGTIRRGSEGRVKRQSSKSRQLRDTVIGGASRKQEEAYTDSKLKQRAYQVETSIATRLPEKFVEIKSEIQGKPTSLDIQIMRQAGEVVSKPKKEDPLDAFTKKMNQRRNTRF